MITEKDYCDYETCVALKELGYDGCPWECYCFGAYYRNGEDIFYDRLFNSELGEDEYLRIPLYLAQKWLREEKKIEIVILGQNSIGGPYYPDIFTEDGLMNDAKGYKTYEEALLEGIKEAIKLLKEERK